MRYHSTDRKLTDEASPAEIAQMRSVIGSLGWIARQCRPDLSCLVSKLQGAVSKARLKDLKETNFALEQVQLHSEVCLKFRHDAISWDNAMVVTVTDASFAAETIIEPDGTEKPHRTQKAFMILLCDPKIVSSDDVSCHVWCWRSFTYKRV